MWKGWMVLGFLVLGWGQTHAQVLTPLDRQPARATSYTSAKKPVTGLSPLRVGNPVALPFLDDFSKGEGNPDPDRWLPTGGVFTSNRYARQPRTIFAATFDGLKANGEPYSTTFSTGPTDTLTSRPILLGGLQPQDSVYLSFFWQAGGLLDAPNFSSSNQFYLRLQFKAVDGSWNTVWNQNGSGRSTDFAPVMIALSEEKYLHDQFQFRFMSSGSQAGLRDVWHLDYVHLGRNRRLGRLHSLDVALTQRPRSLLRRYTAMPFQQFQANPEGELRDEVGSEIVNLSNLPAAISWRGFTQVVGTAAVDTFLTGSGALSPNARRTISAAPPVVFLRNQPYPFTVQSTIFLTTKEPNRYTRYNDTVSRLTHFQDFFAYDDGSAEAGFSFPSSNAVQVAYQFDLNQPDRVKQIRIYFTSLNTPGTELFLRVWADNGGKPAAQPLVEQRITVPATLNAWVEVDLPTPVEVEGRFYIGYRQPGGSAIVNLGLDFQENAQDKVFAINGPGDWSPVTGFEGAIMLRPLMAGTLTSASLELPEESSFLYPNPAVDFITLSKDVDRLELYSLTGQRVQVWVKPRAGERLVLGRFPAGVYLARAFTGTTVRTTKLILQP